DDHAPGGPEHHARPGGAGGVHRGLGARLAQAVVRLVLHEATAAGPGYLVVVRGREVDGEPTGAAAAGHLPAGVGHGHAALEPRGDEELAGGLEHLLEHAE